MSAVTRRGAAAVLAAGLAWGCAAGPPVMPFADAGALDHRTREEDRLWLEADRFDAAIAKMGTLYDDPAVTAYVQSVVDRLYPEFAGRIHVHLVATPVLNAFSLPNGSVYVHLGMLARLDSEAQLATVLAHEGAHFVNRHGLKERRTVKAATAFAAAGIPILGPLAAVSSIYGYSRELEREADRVGFERLRRAGYAGSEAVATFVHLRREVQAEGLDEPYFFASHPRLTERIESFTALAAGGDPPAARVGRDDYLARTAGVRMAALQADLKLARYPSVILVLEDPQTRARYPDTALYYLGEAYRLRGGEGDGARALAAYREAARAAPGFAPVQEALGLHYLKAGRTAEARAAFRAFLDLAPDSPDAPYVRGYLDGLGEPGPQGDGS